MQQRQYRRRGGTRQNGGLVGSSWVGGVCSGQAEWAAWDQIRCSGMGNQQRQSTALCGGKDTCEGSRAGVSGVNHTCPPCSSRPSTLWAGVKGDEWKERRWAGARQSGEAPAVKFCRRLELTRSNFLHESPCPPRVTASAHTPMGSPTDHLGWAIAIGAPHRHGQSVSIFPMFHSTSPCRLPSSSPALRRHDQSPCGLMWLQEDPNGKH